MKVPQPYNHSVAVAELVAGGSDFELTPNEEERAVLAQFAGVEAVPYLIVRFKVTPDSSGGAGVVGRLEGTVRQTCIVSLEAFDNAVQEDIAVRFVPEGATVDVNDAGAELGEEDPQDVIKNGAIDLGALTSEFLALAIDPYPRRPGAVFTPPADAQTGEASSPFAILAKLKEKGRQVD